MNFDCVEHDGYWVARTVETGVVGGWTTHVGAEEQAGLANLALVKEIKEVGKSALDAFFEGLGVEYTVVSECEHEQIADGERRVLIA